MRTKISVSKKDLGVLRELGVISRPVYYRALNRGWITLGWQQRGGIYPDDVIEKVLNSDVTRKIKEYFEAVNKPAGISYDDKIKLYEDRFKIVGHALKRYGYTPRTKQEKNDIADEAYLWALQTKPNNYKQGADIIFSRAPVIAEKLRRTKKYFRRLENDENRFR